MRNIVAYLENPYKYRNEEDSLQIRKNAEYSPKRAIRSACPFGGILRVFSERDFIQEEPQKRSCYPEGCPAPAAVPSRGRHG